MLSNTQTQYTSSDANDSGDAGPILFLISSLIVGGSERKIVRVLNELDRKGWDVHLAYLNEPTTLLKNLSDRVPVVCLERKGKLSLVAIKALRSYIHEAGICKVVCINLYPLIYAELARALPSSRPKPSLFLMVNTTEHIDRRAKMQMVIYRPLMRRAQKVIFGCRVQLELWCTRYGLDERKCGVIYNGVDESTFAPTETSAGREAVSVGAGIEDTDFVIGTVGQLRPEKNQAELIAVLSRLRNTHPNARLILVGEGSEREQLGAAATSSGLSDRVSFLGQQGDVRAILETMDVFVLPSISETFSNAALEAMSMARVVVLSETGGSGEMVDDGVNGFIYSRGHLDTLAAIIRRLADEPWTRKEIGARARQTVLERFSFDRMVEEYEQLLLDNGF